MTGLPLHVRLTIRLMAMTDLEQRGLLKSEAQKAELAQLRKDVQEEFSRLAAKDLERPDHPFHNLDL